jgi:hypothetical protein
MLMTYSKPRLHVQLLRNTEPFSENELLKHGRHDDSSSAASLLLYLPASQGVHADDPLLSLYEPGGQGVQLKLPKNPSSHSQSSRLSLAAGEVALSKHCMHTALPGKLLYVPGRQAWQPSPSPSDAV